MAVRVRKLARELGRSPWDLLGVCHALGFTRYRSPEDMLPDATVDKVRGAVRRGVQPLPVAGRPARSQARQRGGGSASAAEPDLMSSLVPGVVPRRDKRHPRTESRPAPRPAPESAPASAPPPGTTYTERSLAAERAALDLDRAALEDERAALHHERASLDTRSAELEQARALLAERERALAQSREELSAEQEALHQQAQALERARAALERRRSALVERVDLLQQEEEVRVKQQLALPSLSQLLEERGLRGLDEQERALGALASRRLLRELILELRVQTPEEVARWLERRLVLVEGSAPELSGGLVAVQVAPERAELPRASEVQRLIKQLGEKLMIHGLRRVAVVGGRPAWQRLLHAGLDPRIEVRFSPGSPRGRAEAEADVTRTDVVILWSVPMLEEARAIYDTSRAVVVRVDASSLPAMVASVLSSLDESA